MTAARFVVGPSRVVRALAVTAVVVALQLAVAAAISGGGMQAGATIVLLASAPVLALSPVVLAAFAVPGVFLTSRLALGGLDLSYADAVLVATTLVALRFVPWQSVVLRRVLLAAGTYLGVLGFAVIANPTTGAVVEWAHRIELLGGAILVGAAVAAQGHARVALRLFVGVAGIVAVFAVLDSVSSGFAPSYPLWIHKNAAGFFLVSALIMTVAARELLGVPRWAMPLLQIGLLAGLLACQARASAVTLVLVLLLHAAHSGGGVRLALPLIGVLAVGAMVWATTQGITDEKDPGYRFNSFGSRIEAYDAAIDLWQSEPLFGVGVRFWTDPKTNDPQEPHNLAISALAESGIVGLAALVLLHAWLLVLLWPRRDPLGLLAAYVVIAHVVDSIAGIFWVAGTGTLGWLLVGLAAGVERHRDATSHLEQHPSIAER